LGGELVGEGDVSIEAGERDGGEEEVAGVVAVGEVEGEVAGGGPGGEVEEGAGGEAEGKGRLGDGVADFCFLFFFLFFFLSEEGRACFCSGRVVFD
jgi:hypothetical protein